MIYPIQPNIFCENCITCGKRPVVEQAKNGWIVKCTTASCDNYIIGKLVDIDGWNQQNKKLKIVPDAPAKKIV